MANLTLILVDGAIGVNTDKDTWPDYAFVLSGLYLTLVFIVSLFGNSIILFLFVWDRHLRTPTNMFLLSLTITDWLVTIAGIPFVTSSIYAHRWLFAHVGCIAYAFIMTFLGLNALMSHAVIAVDRYLVITKPHFGIVVTYPKAFIMISIPWIFSFAWAVFPLAGWGEFAYEGTGAWCSVRWDSDNPRVMSYVLGMMFLTFVSSIVVMAYCYACIFLTMWRMPKLGTSNSIKTHEKNRRRREQKLLKTLVAIAIAFLAAWSPYAITSMIAMFGHPEMLTVTETTLPSLFAKGSVMVNPIIYAVTSVVFRKSFKKMLTSFFPGYVSSKSRKSTPSSSKRTVPFSSDDKIKKDDQTSSVLIPGTTEICAATIPVSRSGSVPEVIVQPSGKRVSAAIEMDRLNKLLPGKHKKGRPPFTGRRESDVTIPDTGYKTINQETVIDQLHSHESQISETEEGAIEEMGEHPHRDSVTSNKCSLELDHIIDGIHGKYAGIKQDMDAEDDTNCDESQDLPGKESQTQRKLEETSCAKIHLEERESKRKRHVKAVIDNDPNSQSSVTVDSGVFDTCSTFNTAKKSPTNEYGKTETEI
ncbi:rhodopsin-like [Lytechinus variegatus]|uniref:rhodopsin-like n=1 Tax=Lytechinus variegatus TaxID=7654 RepID=UPI001BB118BA|nr:rhodopsin-like [Lytechinus variegatus]